MSNLGQKAMVDQLSSEPLNWFAETKFHPPLLRDDVISRQHLIDDLRSKMLSYPLTLLSAPAGYGKTTLLASLYSIYPELSVAWLALDKEDNDPTRFLNALIIALQQLNPACGAMAQSLLTGYSHQSIKVRRVASVLINDVLETFSQPFTLILDDLHRITEPSNFITLDYLLEHRPPQLHLVVATRIDPPLSLARLRARGEVAELRLRRLRFSDEEAKTFLNERLNLNLSAADLALLQVRTEGWAVGLRLLATSLDRIASTEERRNFIQFLAQSERNVFDFLAEEVFGYQDQAVRNFLLETAILPELTATLCQAVTRRADAGTMLEEIYHRNLFLVKVSPLRGEASSKPAASSFTQLQIETNRPNNEIRYRYHDLFARFLHYRLQQVWPKRVPILHQRAAEVEKDPARAIMHYLAAASWSDAAALIEQIGAEMFSRGYLDSLSRWIAALPISVRESRPRLLHYQSHCAFLKGSWKEAQSLLEHALRGFKTAGDEAGQGEVLADLATCAAAEGDLERCAALFSQALTYPIPPHSQVQALLGRALATETSANFGQIEQDFNAAIALVQQSAELDPLHLVTFPFFHPGFAFLPGGLEHLERICRQARAQVGDKASPLLLMVEEMTTILRLFRGKLGEAIRSGERALALRKRLGGHPYIELDAALFLIIAHAARGNFAAAEPLFDLLFLGVDQMGQPPPDMPVFLFYAGRARWLQGRLQEARQYYTQMCFLLDEASLPETKENRICRVWMRSLLEMAEGRFKQAEEALRQPGVLKQQDRASFMHGSTRLMLSRLYWRQNRIEEALGELAPVLAYHKQLGIPFPILVEGQSIVPLLRLATEKGVYAGYASSLLALLSPDNDLQPVEVPRTGATLTPREVEVLCLVTAGYSNRAIAEDLVISKWTVKSHLTKIYRKLDVTSRTQAIGRARDLGLG